MNQSDSVRIDIEAARALVQWKALFADEVCKHAKRFAAESGQQNRVALCHYRQAAQLALGSLAAAIEGGDNRDVKCEAA